MQVSKTKSSQALSDFNAINDNPFAGGLYYFYKKRQGKHQKLLIKVENRPFSHRNQGKRFLLLYFS